jgi:GT2 family glycosyltransferase
VRFFLTFEETGWCYRAAAMGIPQYVVSDVIVEHVGSCWRSSVTHVLAAHLSDARA